MQERRWCLHARHWCLGLGLSPLEILKTGAFSTVVIYLFSPSKPQKKRMVRLGALNDCRQAHEDKFSM